MESPAESSELRASPTTMLRPASTEQFSTKSAEKSLPAFMVPLSAPSTPPLMEMSIPASREQSSTTPFISMLSVALMEKPDTTLPSIFTLPLKSTLPTE